MKFKFKASPHLKRYQTTTDILNIVVIAVIFVSLFGVINQYTMFGMYYAVHSVLILAVSCITAVVTHYLFYLVFDKLENREFNSFIHRFTANNRRVYRGAPIVTALILALCLPAATPLFVVIMTAFFAEVFAKLLFGGFGHNIFNPAAVGLVFAGVAFGSVLITPATYDTITTATPLSELSLAGWNLTEAEVLAHIDNLGGFTSMLRGNIPGSIGETARFGALIALVFMIYKRALDWVVPITYITVTFVGAWLVGLYLGVGIWFPILHLLSGGFVYGAVFMATDPVTSPVNRQGRVIFAILLAMLTIVIRMFSNHTESVGYSILIMNMFVPMIDRKTANITNKNLWTKWISVGVVFVLAMAVIVGFQMIW